MNEKDDATLHALAGKLGERAAEWLDVEATTRAVLERLRSEPEAARWSWMQPAWLRVAAAIVALLGGALVVRTVVRGDATGHDVAHFVTDDLSDLSAEQLAEVLTTLDQTLDIGGTTLPEAGLEDLDAQQLRVVLRSLEG